MASTEQKNLFLTTLADDLVNQEDKIFAANQKDVSEAKADGLTEAIIDRLLLTRDRLVGIADDLIRVIHLVDPIGEVFDQRQLHNGLMVHKQRVPLGVLAVIYEARPNVTIDVSALAIKSGNAVILRGGSETINSNRELVRIIQKSLEKAGLPPDAVLFVDDPDRQNVLRLLKMYETINLVIPRGGAGLHQYCKENSLIPVIVGGIGICHLFVDESANLENALEIIHNAKTQRPTVCNALDTVLVHERISQKFIPVLVERLKKSGVNFRVDEFAFGILGNQEIGSITRATDRDFDTEWLSLVLGIKVVSSVEDAIAHIVAHSTGHSDGILTFDREVADQFVRVVDSAAVYVNASTRFTDGGQLGLGAEVAISTQKLHARGPMGLQELTSYKWVIRGTGQVRE
jgi:glutamate-5-semialdehyde dehydrogenase